MSYSSRFLASCLALTLCGSLFADTIENERDDQDRDIQALKEWVNTKRQVSLKEIGGDLSISGQVRTEFQNAWETINGESQRGHNSSKLLPTRGYDIEFNLMLDYRTDRTWASVLVEFDNDAGVFSGTKDKVALERAYWGVRFYECDDFSFDIEVGRRYIGNIFDSKIEFSSFFDGILLRYDHAIEKLGDFYIHPGVFLINDKKDQYGYVGEVGLLNIKGTGVYTKYSIIDWDTHHYHKKIINERFRFLISQLVLGYRFKIGCIEKMAVLYSAGLYNHNAKKIGLTDHQLANWGAYVGFSVGQLRKQWDWAFDINYQAVAAQAIPDFDVSGIGMGNAPRAGFYTKGIKPLDCGRTDPNG